MDRKLDIVPLMEWGLFTLPRPCTIAGPCSAESEEQVMQTAKELKAGGINVYRAGIWKPRTHPGCFEGVGAEGLKWMQKAKREYGLAIATEVASAKHVYECLKYGVDLVWIGARSSVNPFMVQEIAEALRDTDIPVLVKNPVNPDLDLWIGALERLNREGIRKIGVIHRGFSTSEPIQYRNDPQWQVAIELRRRYPELPFFCDPSHMGGKRAYIQELSQRAMDLGLDGLMVESHCNPDCALSDAGQQLTPSDFFKVLYNLSVRDNQTENSIFNESIDQLRAMIDVLDENLVHTLSQRMNVSRKIGEAKKASNVAIIQPSRWERILQKVEGLCQTYGLDSKYVVEIFNTIHAASVEEQNKILEK